MAYNPFNIFRRNQKAIFAVVTVIIMFVFVLSSGVTGGDFFEWLPNWIGSKSRKGDEICKIQGSSVYLKDVDSLRRKRFMANQFMILAAFQTENSLEESVQQSRASVSTGNKETIDRALSFLKFLEARQNIPPQFAMQVRQTLDTFSAIGNSPTANQAEKDIVRQTFFRLDLIAHRQGDLYFLNAPNSSSNDEVNFLLWQKKADQLGIHFTTDDIYTLISLEFRTRINDVPIRKHLREKFSNLFNFETCIDAIGQEFRVRAAQLAVFGPGMVQMLGDKSFNGRTIFSTPFEIFDFYRDKCSPTEYLAIPVPASGFVDKIKGEPTEKEMDDLWREYKNQEPNPGRESPGFKTPRMIKLEWVSTTGAEPYYSKAAEESLKVGELQSKIGSLFIVPVGGPNPAWLAAATAPIGLKDPLLAVDSVRTEYTTSIKDTHERLIADRWPDSFGTLKYLDTNVVRPATIAAALGGLGGGAITGAGPFASLATYVSSVNAFELRDRICAEMPRFLGAIPLPGILPTLVGGQAAYQLMLPKPLSIEAARPELIKHLTEQTARQLMLADLKSFSTEVAKVGQPKKDDKNKDKKPTPEETKAAAEAVEKYIAEFVAKRGWQRGRSEKLQSEWTLEDDPGLAPLKQAFTKTESPHGDLFIPFGGRFFWLETGGGPSQKIATNGNYKPEDYPSPPSPFESPAAKADPKFLVWRTEDTPSKPTDFESAKPLIRAAWKRIKAREEALKRAETLANSVRASAGDSPELIDMNVRELANTLKSEISDPKTKERIKSFSVENVCPLSPIRGLETMVRPFELTSSSNIPYPTREIEEKLLAERTKPLKTTLVLADGPKDTYYVMVVKKRSVKTENDFHFSVYMETLPGMSAQFGGTRREVMNAYNVNAFVQSLESVNGLLKQEFKFEATEEQKKKLQEKGKADSEF